jgi:flagellar biosynthesis/type III secretory pathway ATPase
MNEYEIVEMKSYIVTADSEEEAYGKFGNYEHDEESDFDTAIRKLGVPATTEWLQQMTSGHCSCT